MERRRNSVTSSADAVREHDASPVGTDPSRDGGGYGMSRISYNCNTARIENTLPNGVHFRLDIGEEIPTTCGDGDHGKTTGGNRG